MHAFRKAIKYQNKQTMVMATFVFLFFQPAKLRLALLAGCFFVLSAQPSYAQLVPPPTGNVPAECTSSNCGNYTLNDFVAIGINGSNWILGIVGSLALLFFVYGGMTWILSAGSSERIEAGKTIVKNALIGLIIVFVSWTIINFTATSLGYDSSKFGEWFKTP